jgi:hypothetical protein
MSAKGFAPGATMVIVFPQPAQGPVRPTNSSATFVVFPQCGQVKEIGIKYLSTIDCGHDRRKHRSASMAAQRGPDQALMSFIITTTKHTTDRL